MSAGEERSASGGGGWTNSASLSGPGGRRRSGSLPFSCQAFRDLIDGKDIAHRAGCFRVAIIRITEHFVFQGAEGAEAAAELTGAVSGLGITLKSFKFLVKNSVLGSGGCRFALRVLGGFWRVY